MITINLLPQEYRKKERTPLVLLLPFLAGIVGVLSAVAVAAYVHFAWLAEVQNDREAREQNLAQKKPMLKHETDLLAEEAEFTARADTIRSIASGRILFTRIVDEFADVVTEGDSQGEKGYLIWLKELSSSPAKDQVGARGKGKSVAKTGGSLAFTGFALTDRDPLADFNAFHERLQVSRTYAENFLDITVPEGRIESFTDELLPTKGWSIKQSVTLRDPAEVLKARTGDGQTASRPTKK